MTTQESSNIKTFHNEDGIYPKRQSQLKEERFEQLIENSRQEILRQIIGPFGLTPAIFDDKDGGNVATMHNAEKSVFPDKLHKENYSIVNEQYDRENWDDTKSRKKVREKIDQAIDSGQNILSPATNQPLVKGKFHGDHTVSLKEVHEDKELNLRFTENERKKIVNSTINMVFIEASLNQSKGKKSWDECLNDPEFIKKNNLTPEKVQRIKEIDEEARNYIKKEKKERLQKELLFTGMEEAAKSALHQALGFILHEFVNGSFVEVKILIKKHDNQANFIDRLITSLKRVVNRVIGKFKNIFNQMVESGFQGFMSNLLTFFINSFITTSKKIVTLIRESLKSLSRAFELLLNPPEGMTSLEITREVSKIIGVAVTTGLGMMMEEAIKGFIMSVPIFTPIADVLATGVTAIMTGLTGALVVYGIDRIFDSLTSKGTERLEAQEAHADAQIQIIERLSNLLNYQFQSSQLYDVCVAKYQQVQRTYSQIEFSLESASLAANTSIDIYQSMSDRGNAMTNRSNSMLETWEAQIERRKRLNAELDAALNAI